ncbi:ATP-binding protein [Streptacidiphilus sp. PAMC 29251]
MAVSGVVHGDVAVHAPSAARSGYRQQVLRIAPSELGGREAELAELAAFCTAPDMGPYAWWRALAWSGKTALMAWFALHPPESVEIVPFFITARFAGQSDRTAFTEVVGEQLTALLGQPMPAYLTEATREGHLLAVLEEAAHRCRQRGERLVLLVDGLDEDRGVTTGPDAYSIAALLPARPPAGMRVIVAGRPDPPVPGDVPENHPLHDPGIVRPLEASPFAAAVRADCERELARLLRGAPEERDLLGLVAAAGGGLSRADLAELAGCDDWEVAQHLRAVTGRTFTVRAGGGQSVAGPVTATTDVYVLGHEELQTTALTMLGQDRLSGYRGRLHAWAGTYCDRGWPPDTPEYLLRGYARLLRATADLPRAVACATDSARHDRIRELTGGDTAALAEIVAAGAMVLACDEPDLVGTALLVAHHNRLVERNTYPVSLPAVWAAVGQADRAEALARGSDYPEAVGAALAEVAVVVGFGGDRVRAARLADTIEGLNGGSEMACWRARRMVAVAEAAGAGGDLGRAAAMDRAMDVVLAHATAHEKALVLAAQARAAAAGGDRGRAGELADAIEELARTDIHSWCKGDVQWAADSEDPERVAVALGHLGVLARTVRSTRRRAAIEAMLAAAAAAGIGRHGAPLLEAAAELSRWARPPLWALEVVEPLTEAVVASGDAPRAARLVDLIAEAAAIPAHPCWKDSSSTRSLARATVQALTVCADRERAAALSRALEVVASMPADDDTDDSDDAVLLVAAAGAAALAGEDARAEALARAITDPEWRPEALVLMAKVSLGCGDIERAAGLAAVAERFCRESVRPYPRAKALAALARATDAGGDRAGAVRLTGALPVLAGATASPYWRAEVQVEWVGALAAMGESDRAETLARTILPSLREWAGQELVRTLSNRGEFDRAEAFVLGIGNERERREVGRTLAQEAVTHGAFERAGRLLDAFEALPEDRARLLTSLARAAAVGGARHRAAVLAASLRDLAQTRSDSQFRDSVARYAAEALAWSRQFDEAEDLARGITDPYYQADALVALVRAAARSGQPGLAAMWAHRAGESCSRTDGYTQFLLLSRLVEAVTATGDLSTALDLAEGIPNSNWHAGALAKLTRFVEPARGRRLMARALALGNWSSLLDDLGRLAPEALPALTDTLLGWEETGGGSVAPGWGPRAADTGAAGGSAP